MKQTERRTSTVSGSSPSLSRSSLETITISPETIVQTSLQASSPSSPHSQKSFCIFCLTAPTRINWFSSRVILSFFAIFSLILALWYLPWSFFLTRFLVWVATLGWWGNIFMIFAQILVSLPFMFGYVPLAMGSGFIFGFANGMLTTSFGSTTGAILIFCLIRCLARKWMEAKIAEHPKMTVVLQQFDGKNVMMALLLRMAPVPFGLMNSLFAVSPITLKMYIFTTFVGLLPFQLLWVYFGTTVRDLTDTANTGSSRITPIQMVSIVAQVIAALAAPLYMGYRYAKYGNLNSGSVPERNITQVV